MDDKDFDDLLKNKFESYEHPDPGPSALTNFNDRLASYTSSSWYSKYRTEVFVSSTFVLFTLLNGFIIWYVIASKDSIPVHNELNKRNSTIDSLTIAINKLTLKQQQSSIFIVDPGLKAPLMVEKLKVVSNNKNDSIYGNNPRFHTGSQFHLGSVTSLPQNVYDRLLSAGVLTTENGEAYLLLTDDIKLIRRKAYSYAPVDNISIVHLNDSIEPESILKDPKLKLTNQLSSRMINKIEDQHYSSGIGINLGPHLDLVRGEYSKGSGGFYPRVGITAEWIVSPHWSVETSLDYLNTRFTVTNDFQSLGLPNLNPDLGSLQSAQINTHTLSMPISLKHRWWLTRENQLIIKAGYTPYFSLQNQYLYTYPYPGRPSDSDLTISTVEQVDRTRFHAETFSMAVGVNKFFKRKNFLEVALFFEKSFGKVGQENLSMQLFGIRTAYSFKMR